MTPEEYIAEIRRLRSALSKVADAADWLQRHGLEGCVIDAAIAADLSNNAPYLRLIAREALAVSPHNFAWGE